MLTRGQPGVLQPGGLQLFRHRVLPTVDLPTSASSCALIRQASRSTLTASARARNCCLHKSPASTQTPTGQPPKLLQADTLDQGANRGGQRPRPSSSRRRRSSSEAYADASRRAHALGIWTAGSSVPPRPGRCSAGSSPWLTGGWSSRSTSRLPGDARDDHGPAMAKPVSTHPTPLAPTTPRRVPAGGSACGVAP